MILALEIVGGILAFWAIATAILLARYERRQCARDRRCLSAWEAKAVSRAARWWMATGELDVAELEIGSGRAPGTWKKLVRR